MTLSLFLRFVVVVAVAVAVAVVHVYVVGLSVFVCCVVVVGVCLWYGDVYLCSGCSLWWEQENTTTNTELEFF